MSDRCQIGVRYLYAAVSVNVHDATSTDADNTLRAPPLSSDLHPVKLFRSSCVIVDFWASMEGEGEGGGEGQGVKPMAPPNFPAVV